MNAPISDDEVVLEEFFALLVRDVVVLADLDPFRTLEATFWNVMTRAGITADHGAVGVERIAEGVVSGHHGHVFGSRSHPDGSLASDVEPGTLGCLNPLLEAAVALLRIIRLPIHGAIAFDLCGRVSVDHRTDADADDQYG